VFNELIREGFAKKIESVTDHSEDYCRNYGRNLVNYVATLNYLSRHLVVILVLSGKRLPGKRNVRETSGYQIYQATCAHTNTDPSDNWLFTEFTIRLTWSVYRHLDGRIRWYVARRVDNAIVSVNRLPTTTQRRHQTSLPASHRRQHTPVSRRQSSSPSRSNFLLRM